MRLIDIDDRRWSSSSSTDKRTGHFSKKRWSEPR
jgi:hypothetical protein